MDTREFHEMYQVEDTHWWFVTKRMFIQTILQGKKFARILDIGCGTGRNMLMLKQYGRVVGVDINQLALRYCRQRGLTNLKQATAESLPFTARNFDLVTIFDVLYHQGIKSDIKV
ncbi:MAG: class I SAM-dependent methyltransferase, partial [Patescibacteria group bacterium]